MPFQKIDAGKLSDAVARQIEWLILQGLLRPGERLPAERDLAERLQVSRPSLREAVADLQGKGLLQTRAGSGIYVSDDLASTFPPALARLIGEHDEAVFDYLAFRRDIEGLAAERAAEAGSAGDLAVIDGAFAALERAQSHPDPVAEAALDAAFHMAIIEAGHNVVMVHMMRAMGDLLRQGVVFNRATLFAHRTSRDTLLEQHRTINAAIQKRDGPAARTEVARHMDYIVTELRTLQKMARQDGIAKLRAAKTQTALR